MNFAAAKETYLDTPAIAVPARRLTQKEGLAFLQEHYGPSLSRRGNTILKRFFSGSSIKKRHFAFDDPRCLLREEPDQRIERFRKYAVELASEAISEAVSRADLAMGEVAGLVVNTCTGYLCPGLSSYLMERLDLPKDIPAYDLVGSGCGGALPNLQMASLLAGQTDGVVLCAAVEICSATFQMGDELSLLLSNTLFGDGAAAAVVGPVPDGWKILSSASRHDPGSREAIRYTHRQGQLFNQLSTTLPKLIGERVPPFVEDFLRQQDLSPADIEHWALHTGGEKIIAILQKELGLDDEQVAPSRKILSEYGNLSSPTVLFVFNEIDSREISTGSRCVMLAFGAGLSIHICLLEKC